MRFSMCRDCHKPVRWASTARGYRKPFDLDPSPDGSYVIDYRQAFIDRDGQVVPERWTAIWVSAEFRERAVELHTPHDENCPARIVSGASA